MEGPSASYSKKRKWLIGALMPVMALCLSMGLIFMSATDGLERVGAATVTFNNIVNANIGMHPKWIEDTCISAKAGGVGDTYTSKHKVWHADVTTVEQDKVGNDVVMEKSPSYVFQGTEDHAEQLIETYSLKKGNEVVFNITDGDSAAKVWADAVAFAQTLGEATPLADWSLAGGDENGSKQGSSHSAACTGSGGENHNGFRVGTNTGVRNMYQGNFFIKNGDDGALGQYIIVRLQADWKAKEITTTAPTTVVGPNSSLNNANLTGESDYLVSVTGESSTPVKTTSFNYVTNAENNTPNVFGEGTYLPTSTSNYTRIDNNDSNYVISWDLASNSCDYDGPGTNGAYGYIYNDNCAFSYGRINVPTGVYIVLDLNGHKIDRALTSSTANYYGSVFHIDSKARLEIMDSTAYENASAARIEGTSAAGYNADSTHTTNHKGTITGGYTSTNKLNLPQTLCANLQSNGGGFNLSMWADVVLHSGTVSNNVNSAGAGGAFYQRSKAAVTVFDGYVLDNQGTGGGVTNLGSGSGCPFTMYGGVLAYNKATNGNGGAVNLAESSYGNFHGGEIMYNEATGVSKGKHVTVDSNGKPSFYGCGGAICLAGNTLGILESVTIANNKATSSGTESASDHQYSLGGGGVFVGPAVGAVDTYWRTTKEGVTDHAFKFRGSLQIHGNTANGTTDNVHLGYGFVGSGFLPGLVGEKLGHDYTGFPKIGIGGALIANGIVANVGVTLGQPGADSANVFTSGYGTNGNSGVNTFLYFSSDNATYAVQNSGNEATLGLSSSVQGGGGLTWLIEGTGTDADTVIEKGESTLKIVIPSEGDPTFYYKNPNNSHGLNTSLQKVEDGSQMNKEIKLTSGESSSKLLEVLKDRFSSSNGSLTFEYSMLKVTRISVYANGATFTPSGNDLTTTQKVLAEWKSVSAGGDKNYTITNTFNAVNFRFKMGTEDLTASKSSVTEDMTKAISATDGCISYAGEYSVLYSDEKGTRYENPSFKIRINQVGVEVDRSLYYNGQNIQTQLKWLKDIDWDGSGQTAPSGEHAKLGNEMNQPYFIYSGDYYYPILNADYNSLSVFHLYNPFTGEYSTVSKGQFTGYVLEFTYANEYFGTKQPVQFGSHSGGGIEYQTMHRKPNSISGIGTYVPGVKNAGMYSVKFISSRSAVSADEEDADHAATGVYFAANNFAFSSEINIYVDPASAEVELTEQAKAGFTYDAGELKDEEIVIYDNTSNTHVNPHLDSAAVLEYFLFDDLKFKAGIYDVRTKLYYTLDQIKDWENVRPYGRKVEAPGDDSEQEAKAKAEGRPYFPSYKDSELAEAPTVVWNKEGTEKFDPNTASIPSGVLSEKELIEFQKQYEKETYATSTGKLVYIVDKSSFDTAKKLEGNPMDARRYAVFVSLDLDAGYDDYNYEFDQNADHLVGLDKDTAYFWAFEFTVKPAVVRPYDFDTTEEIPSTPTAEDKNTSVSVARKVVYNGLGQFQLPILTFTDPLGVQRQLIGSAAKFKDGGNTFEELYEGSSLTVLESGYDFIVKYYIKEYDLKEEGKYLDYTNVMNGQQLKVRIYIPEYRLLKDGAWTLTGANGNYAFYSGSGSGELEHDDEGYYYEITYEITPVTVTTSLTVTYTYDGTSREDSENWGASDGEGNGWGGVYKDSAFAYPFKLDANDAAHTEQVGPTVGKAEGTEKKKFTVSNPTYVFGDTAFQSQIITDENRDRNLKFGVGVYAYNTGSPNVGTYSLPTAATLAGGSGLKTTPNETPLTIDMGVVWIVTVSDTHMDGKKMQGFNGTADADGNYGNFVIDPNSSLTVIIEAKNITDDNVFATKIQQAKGGSLPDSATEHGALGIDGDGYADVTYKKSGDAVVQDTDVTPDGKYKMATFPFAGLTTFYRPLVKMNYYKYGVDGTTEATDRGTDVATIKEGTDFTLAWADNNMASVVSEAAGISGAVTGSFASVLITAQGNYTGSLTINFYIRPAIIAIAHTKAYDFTKGDDETYNGYYFDRSSHGIQLAFTNTEDYTPYEGMLYSARNVALSGEQVAQLNTNTTIDISSVAYAYASQELFDAFYEKYFGDGKVDDTELEELNKLYSTSAPVDADVYYVAIALSNENFVFQQAKEREEFPSITGSNFGNGATNNLVRGTFEIKPATVRASLVGAESDGTGREYYNRLSHTASFNFVNTREDETEIPSTVLNEYTVTYQCGEGAVHDSEEGMVDAGKYTVTITVGMHPWFSVDNIDDTMKGEIEIPAAAKSNFLFETTGLERRPFDFEIKPAEIKLDKFADVAYNKAGQGVTLGFTNTERNNEAVPTLADAGMDDAVTADEYTIAYAPDEATPNAKLTDDASKLPLNAGKYNVTVALKDDAKSEEDPSLYNFKFIKGDGQTVNEGGKMEIVSSYTITPATVNASVEKTSLIYNGKEQKQDVKFENALDDDTIIPTLIGEEANAVGTEYSVKYQYDGFAGTEYGGFTNRGSYSITVTLKTDGNYTFGKRGSSYTYTFALSYSILPKSIADDDVTLSETPSTIVYTGESLTPPFTLTATNILGGYTLKENEDYSLTRTRDVEVYYSAEDKKTVVTVTIVGQNNFSGARTFTFTILPAKVSVTANEGTTPDGTITVPYNKFAQALAFTFANKEEGGTVVPMFNQNERTTNYKVTYKNQDATDGKTYTQTDAPVNAGTYTVTVTLTGIYAGGNFTFEDGTIEKTFTLVITPAKLTLKIADLFGRDTYNNEFVYDGQDYYSRLYGFTLDNVNKIVPVGTDVTEAFYLGTYSSGVSQTNFMNVGTYYILFTFTTEKNVDKNYTVTDVIAGSRATLKKDINYTVQEDGSIVIPFSITPAQISVNKLSNKTYTGENIEADITFNNQVSGGVTPSNFTATYSGGTASGTHVKDAGTYTVTVMLTGDDATNFTIVGSNSQSFTVDPAIISASVEEQNFTYDGLEHKQDVLFENALGAVTPKAKGDLATEGNEYSVNYEYEGFSAHGDLFTDRGFYRITVELKKNGNFAFGKSGSDYTYRTVFSYTILPKSIEDGDVKITGIKEGESKTYTGASLTPTDIQLLATAIGGGYTLILNEDYNVTHTRDVEVYYDDAAEKTVVTVTINGQNNFSGTKTFTFTIEPAKVSVTADEGTLPNGTYSTPYNKYQQALAFNFVNSVNEDVVPVFNSNINSTNYTVTYTNRDTSDGGTYTQTHAPINAGIYDVTVTLRGRSNNGNFTFEDGTLIKKFVLIIEKAQLTLTISESFASGGKFVKSFVYDGRDYYARLNNFTLDNANDTVPVGSEVTEAFYLGIYPDAKGGALTRFTDAGDYYILFTFKKDAEKDIGKNYEIIAIYAGSEDVALANETDYTVEEDGPIVIPFEITPAHIIVNELSNKTYTGKDITAEISFTNVSEGSEVVPATFTVAYDALGDHVVNAGTYTVTVTLGGTDATNFEIVAWDDGDTKTRQFIVDPAKLTVSLNESVVNYSGSNYTVQANFTNTSETEIVPTLIGRDYSFSLVATDDPSVTPAYNAVIDAKTYNVTVTLLDKNFVFTDGEMNVVLAYTINAGNIELSEMGKSMTEKWKDVSYNPANAIETRFDKDDFTLVGSRQSDLEGMIIALISCTTTDGEYAQEDGYYRITKKGTYVVTIQVSAPNHNTQTFTFDIDVRGDNVLITVPEDFTDFLTAQYGSEFSADGLRNAFLDLIKNGKLTVENIPNSELTETSGQRVVDWLENYGFAVSVSGESTSTSKHLRAGDYALTVSLDIDGGIRFHEADDAQVFTSITRFYRITPAVITIDWGALESLKFSGRDQSSAIKSGVKIANLLEGDRVTIESGHISIGTKTPTFTVSGVVDAVQTGTEDLVQYYLRLLVDDATLIGDDRGNYVFAEGDRVEERYFEKPFTIARLELNIVLSDSSSYYGNDYTENFAFTYMDASGSSSVDVDGTMLRNAVLTVLKLYLADIEVTEDFPSVNTYQVKAAERSKDFGNFELEFSTAEAKHTINPRPVTLQMASSGSIYGEAIILPDQENAWTLAAGSLSVLDKDLEGIRAAIAIRTDATSASPVKGVYTTSGTVRDNATSRNYDITCADGVYTIWPRPIVIDIKDRSSVYGEALDDNLTASDAWRVAIALNMDDGAGALNYGLRPGDSITDLGVVLSLNLTYSDFLACNRDAEGNIIAWQNVISGACSNSNYTVTAWINGSYMVNPRKVSIVIGNREAIYGDDLARVGSTITLNAPVMDETNTAVITDGDWTYASSLGSSTYAILPVDMNYLTFYVGRADNMSESAYAYVGKYPLVGAWAFGLGDSAVSYCYDITFTGKWTASLNSAEKFDAANDNGAGVYEIKPASITEEGRWTVNKFFYETSNPDKTEENGWFKMFLEQMLFSLKGDFNAPLSDITPSSFTYSPEKSEAGKTTAFTAILRVNGKDELLTIIFAKPQYSGIGSPTAEEPFYSESDHLWYVHTSGNWTSKVSISVANHDDAEFTLTYVISDVVATVSLNASIGALEAVYGDYRYLALAAGLGHYDEKDIKDLPLSKALMEYIFGDPSMIITVTGFETAFPEWTLADCIREIVDNCWVEVIGARISTGGYLMAGSYTLRLVARVGSGFIVDFKASSALLPEGQVDQGAGNRLVIRPREIGIDWVDPASAKMDEIIHEDGDKITYTYSGYEYSQQPMFTDLLTGDLVDAPAYQFLTETGEVVEIAKNVRKGGYYTIKVLQSAIEGADSANYRLPSDMTIRLDIIPREIYITIYDLESTAYGVEPDLGRVFTTDDWQVTAGKGLGLAAGETKDDLGIALRLELSSKNVALYENAVKGEGNNENYEFHFEGGNYEITPKPINITIEDKESFYGDELETLGFTVNGTLAYEDTVDDLHIALAKASGLDVGDYAITGVSENPNYVVTFTDGTYKIKRATNVWTREFQAFEFLEGENMPEEQQPLARFGDVHLHYFYDEACTEEIVLDDVSELEDGVYYVRVVVDGTNNYTALDKVYTFTILPRYSSFGNNMDIGLYVVIWGIQVVALLGAVIFIRRRKNKNRDQKS